MSRSRVLIRYVSAVAFVSASAGENKVRDWTKKSPGSAPTTGDTILISPETEAEILRLALVEKWLIGTIADQLGHHHSTIERVLRDRGAAVVERPKRASISDPYVPLIMETLTKYPRLPASRLFHMARERGYPGTSEGHFRRIVACHRPRKPAEAFLRLKTLPGEQAQVDWGHFGKIGVGSGERPLMGFVMVLSWSRRIFLRFYQDQRMVSFLDGHVRAFRAFGGVPRVALYDNLKSAVLERRGDAIRFHPTLLKLSEHYFYQPRPVAPARGNEKGRVERAIRYVRTSFIPGRTWRDIGDLNDQAARWCDGLSSDRPCPEQRAITVRQAFEQEQAHLLALPDDEFPAEERVEVHVGKTPYVRFDRNDYSVPHTHVRRTLTLIANLERVRVVDGTSSDVVAEHARCWDRGQQIERVEHVAALVEDKRKARAHRGLDRLTRAVPGSDRLVQFAAEQGRSLGGTTAGLLRLLDQYGAEELGGAIDEAVERGVPHPHAVRQSLERRRQDRDLPPALPVRLPDDPRLSDLVVTPHALSNYDQLEDSDETCR